MIHCTIITIARVSSALGGGQTDPSRSAPVA